MNNNHITWFGRYEGYLRSISCFFCFKNQKCIECAAKLFDLMLPEGARVIPMPGHYGSACQMLSVVRKLVERRNDITAYDILKCDPHEANYTQKKYTTPKPIKMRLSTAINFNGVGVFVLDNVICTGVTASAALEVLPDAMVVALAMSSWR